MMDAKPQVVIVGGGFAGLAAARALAHAPVEVTVVDSRNHHLFQPLLYQVATAALSPADIASPIRQVLHRQENTRVLLDEATGVDDSGRRLLLRRDALPFDYLVVATGATHSYFGHEDWARFAPGLKTLDDALEIRRRMLFAFEQAEREDDKEAIRQWLTFVIIGGGPTGVEMAGAMAEVARHTLAHDFRHIDPRLSRVILLEAADEVLGNYPDPLPEKAKAQLEALGVHVWPGHAVTAVDDTGVSVGKDRIAARTVVWGAGVKASPLGAMLGAPVDKHGRVKVQPDLSVPGHPHVYVVGDLAAVEQDGRPVPGIAPAAIQMGRHAAGNIERAVRGQATRPFRYNDKGTLATIGRSRAVGVVYGLRLSGFVAWMAWLLVHIFFLIGFRNRFIVLFTWAWAYLTWQRGARLILG